MGMTCRFESQDCHLSQEKFWQIQLKNSKIVLRNKYDKSVEDAEKQYDVNVHKHDASDLL